MAEVEVRETKTVTLILSEGEAEALASVLDNAAFDGDDPTFPAWEELRRNGIYGTSYDYDRDANRFFRLANG